MSEIDHDAAKELAQKSLRIGGITDLSEVTHDDLVHAAVMEDHPYTQIIKPIAHALLNLHEQLAAERARANDIEQKLGNLLARIHCDGGHYIGKHGWEKACKDAEAIICAERARVQALVDVIHDANGIAYPFKEMQDKMTAILNAHAQGDEA